MKRKHLYAVCSVMLVGLAFFSGCKLQRELNLDDVQFSTDGHEESSKEIENPVTIRVKNGPVIDRDGIVEYFCEQSFEEIASDEEGYIKIVEDGSFKYVNQQMTLNWTSGDGVNRNSFFYVDHRENAGECYANTLYYLYVENEISKRLMELYPEEELEVCSKEEAIQACEPLARACGYGEAQVNVYMLKHEIINNFKEAVRAPAEQAEYELFAPDPDYTYVMVEELREQENEAILSGDYELADEISAEISRLQREANPNGEGKRYTDWDSSMDAYLVVYRSVLNGGLFDTLEYSLYCIYVPSYGRVVCASAEQSWVLAETLETQELISQEDAVKEVLSLLSLESAKGITVTDISMVYSPRGTLAEGESVEVDPCWRIDYEVAEELWKGNTRFAEDDGTKLINAIDGQENYVNQF